MKPASVKKRLARWNKEISRLEKEYRSSDSISEREKLGEKISQLKSDVHEFRLNGCGHSRGYWSHCRFTCPDCEYSFLDEDY